MFITCGKELLPKEGTTQGDNLAMSFYDLSTRPLQPILRIKSPDVKQVWIADDATGARKHKQLKELWDVIITMALISAIM